MSARFTAQYLTPDRGTGASLGEAVLFSTRGDGAASLAGPRGPALVLPRYRAI